MSSQIDRIRCLCCVINNRGSLCFNFITHQSNQNNDHKTGQVGLEKMCRVIKTIRSYRDTVRYCYCIVTRAPQTVECSVMIIIWQVMFQSDSIQNTQCCIHNWMQLNIQLKQHRDSKIDKTCSRYGQAQALSLHYTHVCICAESNYRPQTLKLCLYI